MFFAIPKIRTTLISGTSKTTHFRKATMKQLFAGVLLYMLYQTAAVATELYVFLPSNLRASAVQSSLNNACKEVNFTVFGRVKDFSKQIKKNPPDAILSLTPVLNEKKEFNLLMQGTKKGNTAEEYVLVSVDNNVDVANIGKMKLGVVDILGRKPMKKYVSTLFGTKVKISRVTKQEDLLPLLTFKSVDAIFISQSVLTDLKQKTQLNLVVTPTKIQVGLAGTGTKNESAKQELQGCITNLAADINSMLGVESWKSL